MTLAMIGGQTIEYWESVADRDMSLVHTAWEVARLLQGGKPREGTSQRPAADSRQYSG